MKDLENQELFQALSFSTFASFNKDSEEINSVCLKIANWFQTLYSLVYNFSNKTSIKQTKN